MKQANQNRANDLTEILIECFSSKIEKEIEKQFYSEYLLSSGNIVPLRYKLAPKSEVSDSKSEADDDKVKVEGDKSKAIDPKGELFDTAGRIVTHVAGAFTLGFGSAMLESGKALLDNKKIVDRINGSKNVFYMLNGIGEISPVAKCIADALGNIYRPQIKKMNDQSVTQVSSTLKIAVVALANSAVNRIMIYSRDTDVFSEVKCEIENQYPDIGSERHLEKLITKAAIRRLCLSLAHYDSYNECQAVKIVGMRSHLSSKKKQSYWPEGKKKFIIGITDRDLFQYSGLSSGLIFEREKLYSNNESDPGCCGYRKALDKSDIDFFMANKGYSYQHDRKREFDDDGKPIPPQRLRSPSFGIVESEQNLAGNYGAFLSSSSSSSSSSTVPITSFPSGSSSSAFFSDRSPTLSSSSSVDSTTSVSSSSSSPTVPMASSSSGSSSAAFFSDISPILSSSSSVASTTSIPSSSSSATPSLKSNFMSSGCS